MALYEMEADSMVRIGTEQGETSGLLIISSGQQFFFQKLLYVWIVFLA